MSVQDTYRRNCYTTGIGNLCTHSGFSPCVGLLVSYRQIKPIHTPWMSWSGHNTLTYTQDLCFWWDLVTNLRRAAYNGHIQATLVKSGRGWPLVCEWYAAVTLQCTCRVEPPTMQELTTSRRAEHITAYTAVCVTWHASAERCDALTQRIWTAPWHNCVYVYIYMWIINK